MNTIKEYNMEISDRLQRAKEFGILGRKATTCKEYLEIYKDVDLDGYSMSESGCLVYCGFVSIVPRNNENMTEWSKQEQNRLRAFGKLLRVKDI